MIQFNLLPDVKLEYIKARKTKYTAIVLSVLVAGFGLTLLVGLFIYVNFVQQKHLSNLSKDIETDIAKIQEVPDIDKVLTIQNQLDSLTGLHEAKPDAARVLPFLGQLTPANATISQIDVDYDAQTMTVSGDADSLITVNKFADTLKFTEFIVGDGTDKKPAFSEVVLTSFSVDDEGVSYQLDFRFDPEIYNNTEDIKLVVPSIISTRSQTEKPSDLFQTQNKESQ